MVHYYKGIPREKTEDATSDMITTLYEQLLAGKYPDEPKSWIKWLYWRVRTKLRGNARKATWHALLARSARMKAKMRPLPTPLEQALLAEQWEILVRKTLKHLSPMRRRIFFARYERIPYRTIGEILHVSPGVARVVFMKVLRKLRQVCEDVA